MLLEGPPGIAKTLLAKSFAKSLGLEFRRVQFTPDLMPSDVTGVNVFDPRSATFRFAPGPLFTDILLADEINRTPPKTQSALLEAMEERQVTIDGVRHALSPMFFVIATQNPIEHEGTFPLPEAQLDRFLFKLHLTYPGRAFEEEMVATLSASPSIASSEDGTTAPPAITLEELRTGRALLRQVTLSPAISHYVYQIVASTREHPHVLLGASPRAALYLALAAKLVATLDQRNYVIPDDVKSAAFPTLNHRLLLRPEAFDVVRDINSLIDEIINRVPVPSQSAAAGTP